MPPQDPNNPENQGKSIHPLYYNLIIPPQPPNADNPQSRHPRPVITTDALSRQEALARAEIEQADKFLQEKLEGQRNNPQKRYDAWKQRTADRESIREIRALAREAGMYKYEKGDSKKPGQGYFIITDENGEPKEISEEQFKKEARAGSDEYQNFKKKLEAGLTEQRTSQDADNNRTFRIGDMLTKLSHGDIGGALGEIMQPFGGSIGKWTGKLEERATAARERGGLGGIMKGGLLGGAARLAGPAGLIAAQQAFTRINAFQQDTNMRGMPTGEGFGAGLASIGEGLRLAGSPFDILDRRTAAEMVKGVRSKGFRGEVGKALQDSIGSIFKDLGTEWQGNLELLTSVVDNNVMSVEEFTFTMKQLDNQARESGVGVAALQEGLKGFMELQLQQGGRTAALEASRNQQFITDTFKGTGLLRDSSVYGLIGGALPQWAMQYAGMDQATAMGPEAQKQAGRIMDMLAANLRQIKGTTVGSAATNEQFARFMITYGIAQALLPGFTNVDQLTQFLNAIMAGGNAKRQASSTARQSVERADAMEQDKPGGRVARGPVDLDAFRRNRGREYQAGGGDALAGGTRAQIEILKEELDRAGIDPNSAKARSILNPLREQVFGKGDKTDRYREFEERYDVAREQTRQVIEITLSPEAAQQGYQLNEKAKHETYITKGGGSQGTKRPATNRGAVRSVTSGG